MADHVRLEPAPRVRVRVGGQTIVDTVRGVVVHEGTLPPRYYVPPDEVRAALTATADGARCPWKGLWRHLDLAEVPRAAWTYYETTPVCAQIRDYVAFYGNKVELIVGD